MFTPPGCSRLVCLRYNSVNKRTVQRVLFLSKQGLHFGGSARHFPSLSAFVSHCSGAERARDIGMACSLVVAATATAAATASDNDPDPKGPQDKAKSPATSRGLLPDLRASGYTTGGADVEDNTDIEGAHGDDGHTGDGDGASDTSSQPPIEELHTSDEENGEDKPREKPTAAVSAASGTEAPPLPPTTGARRISLAVESVNSSRRSSKASVGSRASSSPGESGLTVPSPNNTKGNTAGTDFGGHTSEGSSPTIPAVVVHGSDDPLRFPRKSPIYHDIGLSDDEDNKTTTTIGGGDKEASKPKGKKAPSAIYASVKCVFYIFEFFLKGVG
jgi:hypothetical protein